jgi:hypothetical protein
VSRNKNQKIRRGAFTMTHINRIPDLLDAMVVSPSVAESCRRVGIDPRTHWNYLIRSRRGDPLLQNIVWHGVTANYEQHCQNAKVLAAAAIEQAALDRALNGVIVDVFFQGHRQYEMVEKEQFKGWSDRDMYDLGYEPEDRFEKVPVKQWLKPSDQLVIKVLESWHRKYRPHQQVDVNYGGVLRLERADERTTKTIEAKPLLEDDTDVEQRGGRLALGRPAKSSEEMDAWNKAGEFKAQPVTFVDAEGNRTERVAAPDPLLPQPGDSEPLRSMKEKPRPGAADDVRSKNPAPTPPANPRQQSTAGDGRERIGYGKVAPGGYSVP